jgi:hypothetical protein
VLAQYEEQPFAKQVLLLTREFYSQLLSSKPCDINELKSLVPKTLETVVSEIIDVHVDEHFAVLG